MACRSSVKEPHEEDKEKDNPFSQYYGMLLHQQNMLQDQIRTSTYERAMLENTRDFQGKVVLDVGTGTGILAYFAVKAGAKKVYAVELSDMAHCAREIMRANGLSDRVQVLKGKMEEIDLPEQVDIVISEPMGFFLVHERMLETFVLAGQKWGKPSCNNGLLLNGSTPNTSAPPPAIPPPPAMSTGDHQVPLMFPSVGTMFLAPFSDETLYREQLQKVAFWQQKSFYGLDLTCLTSKAMENHFSQPVVGYFSSNLLLTSSRATHQVNFATVQQRELQEFDFPFAFVIEKTAICHGFGCWFSVDFIGSTSRVVLNTSPDEPGTHWYQCRLLLSTPIAVNMSQSITGNLHFVANDKYSYDIDVDVYLDGTSIESHNRIHLQDQMYHYLQG